MSEELVPALKKDAIVQISIGAGFVEHLSVILYHLMDGKTAEEKEAFTQKVKKGEPLETWEGGYVTIQSLIQEIYNKAKEQGKTTQVPMSSIIPRDGLENSQAE